MAGQDAVLCAVISEAAGSSPDAERLFVEAVLRWVKDRTSLPAPVDEDLSAALTDLQARDLIEVAGGRLALTAAGRHAAGGLRGPQRENVRSAMYLAILGLVP